MAKDFLGKDLAGLNDKKLFLFDMDGTIYLENTLFDGAKELFDLIEEMGGKYVFITNNSSKSVDAYIEKLAKMGVKVDENSFMTSSQAAAKLILDQYKGQKIYCQGTKSLIAELKKNGIDVTEEYDESVKFILVGYDSELTYEKLIITSKMLTNLKDVPYYATNPDWVCPFSFGYVPDCGSMCFGLEKATGRAPIYIGKPNPTMVELAVDKYGYPKEQTLVIGDRVYTDIMSGINAGVDTVMVLSGEATMEDYNASEKKPTWVLNSIKDILDQIK